MKIGIIGSGAYIELIMKYKGEMESEGHEVMIPVFDSQPGFDELQISKYNRKMIRWADRVDIIWDQRSVGTVFDFGMTFMAEKPIKIVYLEPKTFRGVMEKYERSLSNVHNQNESR